MGNGYIGIVKGDTKYISIQSIKYSDGTDYELAATDKIFMDVKTSSVSNEVLIHKELTKEDYEDGELKFALLPEETSKLNKGEYVFDIRLVVDYKNIFTIVRESKIVVVNSVTEIPEGVTL